MNTLKMSGSEGIGLAIPVTRICEYLNSLGIELNTNGNVLNNIPVTEEPAPAPSENNSEDNENFEDYQEDKLPVITYIALGVAGLSLIVNIVLTIQLTYQKKKNLTLQYDPRERTDFEIDIWE